MKDMTAMGRFLFVVTGIAGILLAVTELYTAPQIALNRKLAFEKARQQVLPGAARFEEIEVASPECGTRRKFFIGFDENNEYVGVVKSVSPTGYGGSIEMVVGMNENKALSGIMVQSQRETPGLGTKIANPEFIQAFLELSKKTTEVSRFRVKQDGGEIDAITAATISSRAFAQGVRDALSRAGSFSEIIKNEAARLSSGGEK